jgi:hypothetical protein
MVMALGLGPKRSGPPPKWEDASPEAPSQAAPDAADDEACAKCCKQAEGCKFYEPAGEKQVEEPPAGEPAE